jgi:hypothetical protein
MKKIFILLGSMTLLVSCVESVAVMGTGAANGKLVQSSVNTGISYGIKAQTGKTPIQHALTYSKNNKIKKKEKSCSSHSDKKNLDICLKLKERITSNRFDIKKNSSYETLNEIAPSLRTSINKKFKIKYLD